MGIGSNLMVEIQEEEVRDANYESIINEATYLVLTEDYSREAAFNKAKELFEERMESYNYIEIDEEGNREYINEELKYPKYEENKQFKAVKSELFLKFEDQY